MRVAFRTKELQDCFEHEKDGVRAWGKELARLYIKRIRAIQAVDRIEDLYRLPQLKFHELKGDRKGHFAVNLTGRARLILTRSIGGGVDVMIVHDVDPTHYGD